MLDMLEIAKRAGVCKATVSRAISNPSRVSEKTRQRVMKVVDELGYAPNQLAASLRQGRSRNIAVMLPDITNPYFMPIVRGIESVALAKGYSVIINDTQDNPKLEREFASKIRARQIDGIITNSQRIPFDIDPALDIAQQLPPMVNTSEFCNTQGVHRVGVDNQAIGTMATQHLIDLGHRRIAVIAGPAMLDSTQKREAGFRLVLQKSNIKVDNKLIYYGNYSAESGVEGVKALMQGKHRPSAIFCFGDLVALGALHALRELEYNVPDDVSVISVDGIALAKYSAPPLTTVAQPLEKIGQTCVKVLLELIEGKQSSQQVQLLEHELILRRSTGPVRQA